MTNQPQFQTLKKKVEIKLRMPNGLTTAQKAAKDANCGTQDKNTGSKEQERIAGDRGHNITDPSQFISDNLTEFGEKSTHSGRSC